MGIKNDNSAAEYIGPAFSMNGTRFKKQDIEHDSESAIAAVITGTSHYKVKEGVLSGYRGTVLADSKHIRPLGLAFHGLDLNMAIGIK